MEKKNLVNDKSEEELPFSFKKEEVSSEKIKEHWQRIANRIAEKNKCLEHNKNKKSENKNSPNNKSQNDC